MTTVDPEGLGTLFACPGDGERRHSVQAIAVEDVRAHLTGFLLRRGGAVAEQSQGLEPLLRDVRDSLAACTDPGLAFPAAAVVASLRDERVDPVWVAAALAGHFHGCGLKGTWRAAFRAPRSIRFGRSMTASSPTLTVDGDAIEGARLRPLGVVELEHASCLLLAGQDDADGLGLDDARPLATGDLGHRLGEMRAAIDLMRTGAPEYVAWCGDTVRIVAGWPGREEQTSSGSMAGHPGVVYCSTPLNPVRLAESLIHEASHQHFHLVQSAVRLHSSLDEAEYWQPYVKAVRPIERILLAYHAFANVVLFYQRLEQVVRDDDAQRRVELALAQHRPNVTLFRDYLERSNGLTAAGRALFRTLAERVAA